MKGEAVRLSSPQRGLLHLLSRQTSFDGWLPLIHPREWQAARELESMHIVERKRRGIFGLCARILRIPDSEQT